MQCAWKLVNDDDIRSASAIILREADGPWTQTITDTSRQLPAVNFGAAKGVSPAFIIDIDPADFDAVVERVRQLRSDVLPDLKFIPASTPARRAK